VRNLGLDREFVASVIVAFVVYLRLGEKILCRTWK